MQANAYNVNTAIFMYQNCFVKGMEYCMPVTQLTKAQLNTLIWSARKLTLQRACMTMTFPKLALYGSQLYNGFIFEDPYTKQGIKKKQQ